MAGQAPRAFSKFQMAVAAFGVYSLFGDVFGKSPVQVRATPLPLLLRRCGLAAADASSALRSARATGWSQR